MRRRLVVMSKHQQRPMYAAGVIERENGEILIGIPKDQPGAERVWQFPRGLVNADESPEEGMRRFAEEQLGMPVEIISGQPPLLSSIDGRESELRYFFCGAMTDRPKSDAFSEFRWVIKAHLREYEFDPASSPVCEWLLEEGGSGG